MQAQRAMRVRCTRVSGVSIQTCRTALPACTELLLNLLATIPALPRTPGLRRRLERGSNHAQRAIKFLVIENPELGPTLRGGKVTASSSQERSSDLTRDPLELQHVPQVLQHEWVGRRVDL